MAARARMVSVVAIVAVMLILIDGSSSAKINGTKKEEIIAYQDLDTEFQMDSEVYRRLVLDISSAVTGGTGDANKPAVDCGRNNRNSCVGASSGGSNNCADVYNRNC